MAGPNARLVCLGLVFLLLHTSGDPVHAQCRGDLTNEIRGLFAISDSILESVRHTNSQVSRQAAVDVIESPDLFGAKASRAGVSASCLLERQEIFRRVALSELPTTDAITIDTLRYAISRAGAAMLGERYRTEERIGLIFGIGINVVFDKTDTDSYKIVSRRDAETGSDLRYIVEESDSRQFPSAVTGMLVRLRPNETGTRVLPGAVFASVQFSSAGNTGPVNGVSLGVGWRLAGETHLILGYSLYRVQTLREDLRKELGDSVDGRLLLPSGETEESITGTEGANALTLSLAVPVSLRAAFGMP